MTGKARRGILDGLFRRSRETSIGTPLVETRPLFQFEPYFIEALSSKNSSAYRIKCLREIKQDLRDFRFESEQMCTLYFLTNDLLSPAQARDLREEVLEFYVLLAQTQFEQLGLARVHLFGLVEWSCRQGDKEVSGRLELLRALTKEGKCIGLFEREGPRFIAKWMREIFQQPQHVDCYLRLVINLVKYNSAFLDRDVIHKFIEETCVLCYATASKRSIKLALELLDCFVSYSLLRTEVLEYMVPVVCRTVLVSSLVKPSNQLMTKLLGTHLGRAAVAKMCEILEEPIRVANHNLLRGAVVFLGLALCSAQQDSSSILLSTGHTAILVALKKVVANGSASIAAEVCLTLQALLKASHSFYQSIPSLSQQIGDLWVSEQSREFSQNDGKSFQLKAKAVHMLDASWSKCKDLTAKKKTGLALDWMLILDVVKELLEALSKLTEQRNRSNEWNASSYDHFGVVLSNLIVLLEYLSVQGSICGPDKDRLFEIIEKSMHYQRSEQSLLHLLEHRAGEIRRHPADWLNRLSGFMALFYINAPKGVRLRALAVFHELLVSLGPIYHDEICDKIIRIYFVKVADENDTIVGIESLRVIASLTLECAVISRKAKDACVDILEEVLLRPLVGPLTVAAIELLVEMFHKEMESCLPHLMQRVLDILLLWINRQYCLPTGETSAAPLDTVTSVRSRQLIMELALSLRVTARNQLGLEVEINQSCSNGESQLPQNFAQPSIKCSPLVFASACCYTKRLEQQGIDVVVVNLSGVLSAVAAFLQAETNWPLFMTIVERLPRFLQDRHLLLIASGQQPVLQQSQESAGKIMQQHVPLVGRFCQLLCSLVTDARRFKELIASEVTDQVSQSHPCIQLTAQVQPATLAGSAFRVGSANSSPCLGLSQHTQYHQHYACLQKGWGKQGVSPTSSDLQQKIFPVLMVFPIYRCELASGLQRMLVTTVLQGMSSKAAPQCIRTLMLVLLQMPDQMFRLADSVVNKLAQVSDTKAVALPVLDFLSSLIALPEIFSSFTKENYNKVFAIALPYTNPLKFSRYTVALAHHVVALWFLKCKPEFRSDFASFIMVRLRNFSSRTAACEQQCLLSAGASAGGTAGLEPVQRSRSGSLNDRKAAVSPSGPVGMPGGSGGNSAAFAAGLLSAGIGDHRAKLGGSGVTCADTTISQLQDDLVEAAEDFFNQYSQGACSLQPHKSAAERFFASGGQSVTWLSGNKVFTITTSGCVSNISPSNSSGVCENCFRLCRPVTVMSKSSDGDVVTSGSVNSRSHTPVSSTVISSNIGNAEESSLLLPGCIKAISAIRVGSAGGSAAQVASYSCITPTNACCTGCYGNNYKNSARRSLDVPSVTSRRVVKNLSFELAPRSMSVASKDELTAAAAVSSRATRRYSSNSDEHIYHHSAAPGSQLGVLQCTSAGSTDSIFASTPSSSTVGEIALGGTPIVESGSSSGGSCSGLVLQPVCSCWCRNWAEITVRRPSGVISCTVCLQNELYTTSMSLQELNMPDISPVFANLMVAQHTTSQAATFSNSTVVSNADASEGMIEVFNQNDEETSITNKYCKETAGITERLDAPVYPRSKSPESAMVSRSAVIGRRGTFSSTVSFGLPGLKEQRRHQQQKSAPSSPTESHTMRQAPFVQRSASMTEKDQRLNSTALPAPAMHTYGTSSLKCLKSPRNSEKYASIPEEPKNKRSSLPFGGSGGSLSNTAVYKGSSGTVALLGLPLGVSGQQPVASGETAFRDRARTISVMTPARTGAISGVSNCNVSLVNADSLKDEFGLAGRSCLSPEFLFKRLFADEYYSSGVGSDCIAKNALSRPLLIPANSEDYSNSLEVLDATLAYETHKIGVIYVDSDQQNSEPRILSNVHGSERYMKFLEGLGSYVCLRSIHGVSIYSGGLDTKYGEDGNFSIVWHDDVMQVMFHVATLMPTLPSDLHCAGKKKHIGNDFVVIVYNNSGNEYIPPSKSQFLHACIIVTPQPQNTSFVRVWLRKELQGEIGTDDELTRSCSIHDAALPKYARQLALHLNIASTIYRMGPSYVNNWLERLRIIRRLRAKLQHRVNLDSSQHHQQSSSLQQGT